MTTQEDEDIARVQSEIEALIDKCDADLYRHDQAYRPLDILCRMLRYVAVGIGLFGVPAVAAFALPDVIKSPGLFESDNLVDYVPYVVGGLLGCFVGAWLADPVRGPRATSKRIRGQSVRKAQMRQQFIDRYPIDTPDRETAVHVLYSEIPSEQSSPALNDLRWLTEGEGKKLQREQLVDG